MLTATESLLAALAALVGPIDAEELAEELERIDAAPSLDAYIASILEEKE